MSDANGMGTGGTSEASIVQPMLSNTTNTTLLSSQAPCLRTASENVTSLDFTFWLAGTTVQCAKGLEVQWSGGKEMEPYNITVVPLDQRYLPWDISLATGVSWGNQFVMNMTAGTRFTLMMNSKLGYGRGGVELIYEMTSSPSNDTSCIIQPALPTGSWPADASIDTSLPAASLPPSPDPNTTESASARRGRNAGIGVGVTLGVVLLGLGVWWGIKRRRRSRKMKEEEEKAEQPESQYLHPSLSKHISKSKRSIHSSAGSTVVPFLSSSSPAPAPASSPPTPSHLRNKPYSLDLASLVDIPDFGEGGRDGRGGGEGANAATSISSTRGSVEDLVGFGAASTVSDAGGNSAPSNGPSSHPAPSTSNDHRRSPSPTIIPFISSPPSPVMNTTQPSSLHARSDSRGIGEDEERSDGELVERARQAEREREEKHPQTGGNGMRLTNPDNNHLLPALAPSPSPSPSPLSNPTSRSSTPHNPARRRPPSRALGQGPERTYRRHADAGRVFPDPHGGEGRVAEGEVVDLPPLYSEVPRDGNYLGAARNP
ncbi:hypothetical protein I350_05092 [Cryptococcus amylolentus CBS 6273]|uniref:Uncharacterized protein n=1 Tax=Cryptococcus amylolentus CBS 6273 TaxID=1296118 RepID=A0A1E3JUG8_9TREE|nr:hypothetical protein I350_05092 [Cryptococcus amylolentus CBS 6273]